jgi:hypothetical protein
MAWRIGMVPRLKEPPMDTKVKAALDEPHQRMAPELLCALFPQLKPNGQGIAGDHGLTILGRRSIMP